MKPRILVIVGATASGKACLARELYHEKINNYLISADSRKIYREADIGTAKPTREQLNEIPHYMIDIIDPPQHFSAAKYAQEVNSIVTEKKGFPCIFGGSGLYIKALFEGVINIPEVDIKIREEVKEKINKLGLPEVYRELQKIDPEAFSRIHYNDAIRISRGLEVYYQTGRKLSDYWKQKKKKPFQPIYIGLTYSAESLRRRIKARVIKMLDRGLIREVEKLKQKYGEKIWLFSSIGYSETLKYCRGLLSLNQLTDKICTSTWHYARKQLVWFKKNKKIYWFDGDDNDNYTIVKSVNRLILKNEI
ncbi:MAG: tRNA (adenosine(37)-N6)-dimethylallyltransferase MiaA [bacterium]